MSSKGLMRTVVWTELLGALRQDGLIAHCVLAAGPATSAFIKELVSNLPEPTVPAPAQPAKEYITVVPGGDKWHVLRMEYDETTGAWAPVGDTHGDAWENKENAIICARALALSLNLEVRL